MGKRRTVKQIRFRRGSSGSRETLLYEFRDFVPLMAERGDRETKSRILGFEPVLVAASNFEEAFAHLRKIRPRFRVKSARYVGLIELSSGSPLD
jgi:hypothetical protein